MESKYSVDNFGNIYWKNSRNKLHRENDLPAIEYKDGSATWYINGRCHRENGPAIINKLIKSEYWYLNGIEYKTPEEMPLYLFLAYCKWELNKNER